MSIRQSRPFTVEVKGKRRKPFWATADLGVRQLAEHAPPAPVNNSSKNGSHATVPVAADVMFRRLGVSGHPSTPNPASIERRSEPVADQTEAAVRPRVLPDLTAQEDLIAVRLREEAEERAARRHRPRGSRRTKVEVEADRTTAVSGHGPNATKEVRRARPLTQGRSRGAAPKAQAPKPIVRQTASTPRPSPSAIPAQTGRNHGSRWAARAEVRKAKRKGLLTPFRPGERWKRRLPKSAW